MTPDQLYGMPHLLRYVAERLGVKAAVHLSETLGGETVSVPGDAEGSVLADRIGIEIATVLSEEWGSERVAIPNGKQWQSVQRRLAVLANPTTPNNTLARELGITERHVRGIRAAHRRKIRTDAKRRKQAQRT